MHLLVKQFTFLIALATVVPVRSQEPRATLRIEVRSASGPIGGANVTLNGLTIETGGNGVAIAPVELGRVDVKVTKQGFLPGSTSLVIDEPREWQLVLELQPEPHEEAEITVYATRTGARLQDLPTRVEVLGPKSR